MKPDIKKLKVQAKMMGYRLVKVDTGLKWSRGDDYHYYGDENFGYGHVISYAPGVYGAYIKNKHMTFSRLKDAKAWVAGIQQKMAKR